MSKKIFVWLLVVLMLMSACGESQAVLEKEGPAPETVVENPQQEVSVDKQEAKPQGREEAEEQITNANWPYPPVDMNKPVSDDPDVIKYLNYFIGSAQHVVFLEMNGEKISDKSMAVYSFLEACMADPEADISAGFQKEQLDEYCMKYFGRLPASYESSMLTVNPQTGKIQSTGWGGSAYYHVLKEKEELSDGTVRLLFDLVEPYSSSYDLPITYEEFTHAVYSGQLECIWPSSLQKEYILTELTDENGEFYVQYHSVRVVE